MPMFAPWLILAYVAFVGAILIGIFISDPWVERLSAAASQSSIDEASTGLRTIIAGPLARTATWGLMILIAAMVVLMVAKPLG